MDLMQIMKLVKGEPSPPREYFLELEFSSIVGSRFVTQTYGTYGVEGNILYVQSDYPIDIRYGDKEENLNVMRQIIAYPTEYLQIRKSSLLISSNGNANPVTDGSLAGRVRIWGFNAPSVADVIQQQIKQATGLLTVSTTFAGGSVTTSTVGVDLTDRVLTYVEILSISAKRATSNLSRIRYRDADIATWYYGGKEFTAGLFLTTDYPNPVVVPNKFTIEFEGVGNAAATALDIELTYRRI